MDLPSGTWMPNDTDGPFVAVDAMGGDKAPVEIIAGCQRIVEEDGIKVVVVGPPDRVGDVGLLPLFPCSEVISMDEDPVQGVRRKKDSSLVRAAELVRDSKAIAMVSAGNTGATMAAALLRMGRLPGVIRPCIATPLPRLGERPAVLVDAGANAECTPAMLVQFARMGVAYARSRFEIDDPTVGLLSIGEESAKGTPLVKQTHAMLSDDSSGLAFVGNLEGRDLMPSKADVVVTDGFTGNVVLKTLEGTLRFIFDTVVKIIGTDDETLNAGNVLLPHLLGVASQFDPENTGGAMLLGVDGVCVISHGSSSALAIANAIRVAHEVSTRGMVARISEAVSDS